MRGPIVGAELFTTVMAAAAWVCQCTGQCGSAHRRTGGTCQAPDTSRARLVAAPARPLPEREAFTATADQLRAWCPACWRHTASSAAAARAQATTDTQESLF
ncbi:hypothetical protein [Actinacidiphila oryziradicis]|nr:hypothetical protein [Actinacidiphila oryziradicis]